LIERGRSGPPLCDDPGMEKSTAFRRVRDRLAALQDRGEAAPAAVRGGPGTPEQQDAMRETLEILSDPAMMLSVQAGRRAVAIADVVALERLAGSDSAAPGEWSVVVTGPVARDLEHTGGSATASLRETLAALASAPAEQGRALGMGLVGVWSKHGGSHRVLYAVHRAQRRVTVLSVDER